MKKAVILLSVFLVFSWILNAKKQQVEMLHGSLAAVRLNPVAYTWDRSSPAAANIKQYEKEIETASAVYGVPSCTIAAVIMHESRGHVWATGAVGEIGLMQLRPEYFLNRGESPQVLRNPIVNIQRGTRHIAYLTRKYGNEDVALVRYNAGENRSGYTNKYVVDVNEWRAALGCSTIHHEMKMMRKWQKTATVPMIMATHVQKKAGTVIRYIETIL